MIFERFNDTDLRFNNDQILDALKGEGVVDDSLTADDAEPHFRALCDQGLIRNIAENFTTIWFKLFEKIEEVRCNSCARRVHLGTGDQMVCPYPSCGAPL